MGARLAGLALVFGVGFSVVAWGQGSDGQKTLTPEGSLNLRNVADLQFSPDAGRLAFVVTEPAKGTGRFRHIWLYDVAGGVARQVTFSAKSELSPRWRPEAPAAAAGETPFRRMAFPGELAFLSDREEGQQQIYLMSMNGGEGRAITKGKRSVKGV